MGIENIVGRYKNAKFQSGFCRNFLEPIHVDDGVKGEWSWQAAGDVRDIYASGAPTSTRQSTYAGETDDRSDSDRPNEGMKIA